MLANLRETARLFSTHYSTMIEGNRLTQEQVAQVIGEDQHFPGRERALRKRNRFDLTMEYYVVERLTCFRWLR